MGVKFKVTGLRELERALRRTEKRVEKATESVMRQAAKAIMRESVNTVSIDTGALQASGMWFQVGTGYNAVITVGHGFPVFGFYDDSGREKNPAEYAVYHHEGVNPWFEGSVYTVAPTIHLLVTQRISKALRG